MKLSEAIREGAKIRPQWFGAFFSGGDDNRSCALGAAMEGSELQLMGYGPLREQWPELLTGTFPCPAGCKNDWRCEDGQTIEDLIQHLNDACRWTREQIADHLESLGY
jgi:hypothetical protein